MDIELGGYIERVILSRGIIYIKVFWGVLLVCLWNIKGFFGIGIE